LLFQLHPLHFRGLSCRRWKSSIARIEGWQIKLCDTIADNASSARVVLGNSPTRIDQLDLKLIGMILEKNGGIVQT
jgi:2-keto-4-pentenoate hydratase